VLNHLLLIKAPRFLVRESNTAKCSFADERVAVTPGTMFSRR
jgi:hypothetical protein